MLLPDDIELIIVLLYLALIMPTLRIPLVGRALSAAADKVPDHSRPLAPRSIDKLAPAGKWI